MYKRKNEFKGLSGFKSQSPLIHLLCCSTFGAVDHPIGGREKAILDPF
jgi:hypothetical protein